MSKVLTINTDTIDCALIRGIRVLILLLLILSACGPVQVATLTGLVLQYFPGADRVGEFEGDPMATAVYQEDG